MSKKKKRRKVIICNTHLLVYDNNNTGRYLPCFASISSWQGTMTWIQSQARLCHQPYQSLSCWRGKDVEIYESSTHTVVLCISFFFFGSFHSLWNILKPVVVPIKMHCKPIFTFKTMICHIITDFLYQSIQRTQRYRAVWTTGSNLQRYEQWALAYRPVWNSSIYRDPRYNRVYGPNPEPLAWMKTTVNIEARLLHKDGKLI
jgi:hypothetical protein